MNNKYTFVMFAMSSWFEWQERGITNTNRQILKALLVDPRVERVVLINYLPFSLKRILREFVFSKLWKKKKIQFYMVVFIEWIKNQKNYLL